MQLNVLEATPDLVRAGYACPCGCTPSVEFARGADLVEEGCCCGNHFAVGPSAGASLPAKAGFRPELETFDAPWGQHLEAAWSVGPSVHGPSSDDHDDHRHADEGGPASRAIDPVCGMTVDPTVATGKGLHTSHGGRDFFFCGKGCKLEFEEDPEHYLDPTYVPSM